MRIEKEICQQLVMTGVKYKNNHPGGISAVVQYWSKFFDELQYYPTFKEGSKLSKLCIFGGCVTKLWFKIHFDKKVRILHAHTAAGTDFKRTTLVVKMAKMAGLKVILHSHASSFKDYFTKSSDTEKSKILDVLTMADVLIVLSNSWRVFFTGIGVPEERIVILHNIAAYPTLKDVEKHDNKVRLLFMGEIGERKGIFDLLRAISEHKQELEEKIELRIGGNKQEEKLMSVINGNSLHSFVKFEGFVTGEKKIELLNWANVYVLPSFNEGLPISILEAMSYKMPIVSTPVGGIPEVVDGSNGVLVTPGASDEIYEAIYKYVDNPELIKKHGNTSFEKVQTYMPDYVISDLKKIYERLLSE